MADKQNRHANDVWNPERSWPFSDGAIDEMISHGCLAGYD